MGVIEGDLGFNNGIIIFVLAASETIQFFPEYRTAFHQNKTPNLTV